MDVGMVDSLEIGLRRVGPNEPCFIIAEAGVNHNGNLELAIELVDAAADAGADVVKFQTFKAENLVTYSAPKAEYQLRTTGAEESQYDMIRRLELSPEMHRTLIEQCHKRNILFLSSFFDDESADLLENLGVSAFKMPSGEITNLPLLSHVARKGRPMIVSTGMADMDDVTQAVRTIAKEGNSNVVLLQCVSNYPADPADVNLRAMNTMAAEFDLPVGYSDHTNGIEVAMAAVAMGACVIEKHFTLDRNLPGPDHKASLEPDGIADLVRGIRNVESALGHGRKEPASSEANTAAVARKSLVAATNIPAGTVISEDHIDIKRPGTGLAPVMRPQLVGKIVKIPILEGTLLALDMFS